MNIVINQISGPTGSQPLTFTETFSANKKKEGVKPTVDPDLETNNKGDVLINSPKRELKGSDLIFDFNLASKDNKEQGSPLNLKKELNKNKGDDSSFIEDDYDIYELNSEVENSYTLVNKENNSVVMETIHKSVDSNNLLLVNSKPNKFNNYNFIDFIKSNNTKRDQLIEKIEEDVDEPEQDEEKFVPVEGKGSKVRGEGLDIVNLGNTGGFGGGMSNSVKMPSDKRVIINEIMEGERKRLQTAENLTNLAESFNEGYLETEVNRDLTSRLRDETYREVSAMREEKENKAIEGAEEVIEEDLMNKNKEEQERGLVQNFSVNDIEKVAEKNTRNSIGHIPSNLTHKNSIVSVIFVNKPNETPVAAYNQKGKKQESHHSGNTSFNINNVSISALTIKDTNLSIHNDKKSLNKSKDEILKSLKTEAIIQTVDNNTAIYQTLSNIPKDQKPPKSTKIVIVKRSKGKNADKPLDIDYIKKKIEKNKVFSTNNLKEI
eukprot:CAMPEP_0170522620 /NCGR_PEP_ID=MMETSP0209-20121228/8037_1 /TAXON_ID=665100 ORGANISM="Litonotus pictus, Strain P1" /NCGR_SAMPLE_ID=MMETSP0209 /ASSEMBLY_ACC=CAM_ASM_000301 /LENGTH=490 /DNA_ID=CAMNT_0010810225 /DNA_START=79 /DNA_END=1548 /DNA_ORIENTATION=-